MIPHRSSARHAAFLAACALATAGCEPAHHHDDGKGAVYYDTWEIEPNDSHCCPDTIGTIYVDEQIVIGGNIRDDSYDPFDGFAFTSGEPLEINFVLEPVDCNADLDLCVWDPALGNFAFCFESPDSVETGRFVVPSSLQDFHLVVMSYIGDAEYRLTVWAEPASLFAAENPAPSAPTKAGRAVAAERYGPAQDELEAPQVLQRGVAFEIDPASGAVRTWALEVRRDGLRLETVR